LPPLFQSYYNELPKVVELLVEHGADPNVIHRPHTSRQTPFLYLALGDPDLFELLIEHGADINIQDDYGNTMLHLAVKRRHTDKIHALFDTDFDPCVKNDKGQTAYEWALDHRRDEYVVELLERYGLPEKCEELVRIE